MLEEAFGWINVLLGFAWLMKLMSLALNDRLKPVVICSAIGGLGVGLIHLVLATIYGSIKGPVIWTFWNVAFLVTSILVAFAVMAAQSLIHRSATRSPQFQDRK
jgi:hypothetical protein